jgi:hypothetical protein
VDWVQAESGPVALSVDPGGPAWAAGLLPGDILVSAEGRPIGNALEAAEIPWTTAERPVHLQIRRGPRTTTLAVQPVPRRGAPDVYVFLSVVALAFLASALFIALRNPGVRGGTIYSLLGACLYAVLVLSHSGRGDRLDWLIYWTDIAAGAFAPSLLLHLALALSRRGSAARILGLGAAYATSVGVILLAVWLVGLGGAHRFPDPVTMAETTDRIEILFLAVAVVAAGYALAGSYRHSASGTHRTQMRFMLWGLGVGLAPLITIYGIPWALGAVVPGWVQFLSVVPLVVVRASFTAALVRYRLHDLDLLLRRGLAEVTAIFCIWRCTRWGRCFCASPWPISASEQRAAVRRDPSRGRLSEGAEAAGGWTAIYRKRYEAIARRLDFGRELARRPTCPRSSSGSTAGRGTLDVAEAGC